MIEKFLKDIESADSVEDLKKLIAEFSGELNVEDLENVAGGAASVLDSVGERLVRYGDEGAKLLSEESEFSRFLNPLRSNQHENDKKLM